MGKICQKAVDCHNKVFYVLDLYHVFLHSHSFSRDCLHFPEMATLADFVGFALLQILLSLEMDLSCGLKLSRKVLAAKNYRVAFDSYNGRHVPR